MQNKKKSLAYNGIMNLIYTGSRMLFPLITVPYLARVLGVESTGRVDFIISIANYFVLIAGLGMSTYGIRVCAQSTDNKAELSKSTYELLILNTVSLIFSLIVYIICIFSIEKLRNEISIAVLGIALIVFRTYSMDWFYQGIEEYDYITKRTLLMRFIALLLIFLGIHSHDDYMIYGISCVLMDAGASICNLFNLRKYVSFKGIKKGNYKKHIKPVLVFFLSSIAISIYNQIDVTMIGWIKGNSETGYYEYGIKPVKIIWTVIIGLTTVVMSRIVIYIKEDKKSEEVELRRKALNIVFYLSVTLVGILYSVSDEVIGIICGDSYGKSAGIFKIFVFAVIPVSFSNYFANVILLPYGKEKNRAVAVNVGLVVDVVLNYLFIPKFGACGAACATLITEFVVCICLLIYTLDVSKDLFRDFAFIKKSVYLVSCVFLGALSRKIINDYILLSIFLRLMVNVFGCLLVFSISNLDYLKSFSFKEKKDNYKNKQ